MQFTFEYLWCSSSKTEMLKFNMLKVVMKESNGPVNKYKANGDGRNSNLTKLFTFVYLETFLNYWKATTWLYNIFDLVIFFIFNSFHFFNLKLKKYFQQKNNERHYKSKKQPYINHFKISCLREGHSNTLVQCVQD